MAIMDRDRVGVGVDVGVDIKVGVIFIVGVIDRTRVRDGDRLIVCCRCVIVLCKKKCHG